MKKETIEYAATNYAHNYFDMHETNNYKALKQGFENGAKWQQENSYSEEYILEKLFNHPAMCAIRDSKSDAEARRIVLKLLEIKENE